MLNKTHKNTIFFPFFPLKNLEVKSVLLERESNQLRYKEKRTLQTQTCVCICIITISKAIRLIINRIINRMAFLVIYYPKSVFLLIKQYFDIRDIKYFLFSKPTILNNVNI